MCPLSRAPQEPTPVLAWVGVPGARTPIEGYKFHLSSARNVACFSGASLRPLGAHNYSLLDSSFQALAGPGGLRPCFLLEDKRAHSRAPRESTGAWDFWGVSSLGFQSCPPNLSKWVEGHPTTHLLEKGVEMRCF